MLNKTTLCWVPAALDVFVTEALVRSPDECKQWVKPPETSVRSPQTARLSNRAVLSWPSSSEQVSGTSHRCLWSEAFRVAPASQLPRCSQSALSQCECCSVSSETLSSFPVPTGCQSNSSAEHKRPCIMCSLAHLISLQSHQLPFSFYTWAVLRSVDTLRCSSSRLQPCAYSSPCCKCPLSLAFPIPPHSSPCLLGPTGHLFRRPLCRPSYPLAVWATSPSLDGPAALCGLWISLSPSICHCTLLGSQPCTFACALNSSRCPWPLSSAT